MATGRSSNEKNSNFKKEFSIISFNYLYKLLKNFSAFEISLRPRPRRPSVGRPHIYVFKNKLSSGVSMTVPIDRWTVVFSNICRKAIMSEDMSDWSGSFRKNKAHQFEFQLHV